MNKKDRERKSARRSQAREWAQKQDRTFEPTCIKLPDGVEFFKFSKPGKYKLDFMLFLAGKGNKHADEGMAHFERQYDVHRIPTPNGNRMYACRKTEFGKRCAGCEFLTQHGGSTDQELAKALRAQTRHLWLVNDDPGNPDNPLKVLDTNHFAKGFGFGEMMREAITSVDAYADFAELEGGYTLQLSVIEDTFPGGKWNKVTRIDFLPRKYSYPEEVLENAPCLDDFIIDPGYETVKNLLDPESIEEEEEKKEEAPRKRMVVRSEKNGKDKDEDSEEDDSDDDDDLPVVKKTVKTLSKKKDDEEDEDEEDDDSDLDDDDDDDNDDDSDLENEEDDDKPVKGKKSARH